ncbi:MAG: tetratricopeptide repeat protein [Chthonomonadales bacterium]
MTNPEPIKASVTFRRRSAVLALLAVIIGAAVLAAVLLRRAQLADPPPGLDDEALETYYTALVKAHPQDPRLRLRLAEVAERRGFWMEALENLDAAGAQGAQDRDAAFLAGKALLALARVGEARAQLEAALRADPRDAAAAMEYAWCLARMGDLVGAGRSALSALQLRADLLTHPRQQDAPLLKRALDVLDLTRDRPEAVKVAHALTLCAPDAPDGYLEQGRHLMLIGRIADAVPLLERAVAIAPEDPDAHYLYGIALARAGKPEAALPEWRRTLSLDPMARKAWYRLAERLACLGAWDTAARYWMNAARLERLPERAWARAADAWHKAGDGEGSQYCRAWELAAKGSFDEALAKLAPIIRRQRSPWRKPALDAVAEVYRMAGRPVEFLKAALSADGGSAEDALRISDACLMLKQFSQRIRYLLKALRLDPQLAPRVYRELAAYAETKRRWDKAEAYYRKAVEADPRNAAYHQALAHVLIARPRMANHIQEAVAEAERATRLDPEDASAFHQLGVACVWAGDLTKAHRALLHGIDLQPGNAAIYLDLIQTLTREGKRREAARIDALYRDRYAAAQELKALQDQCGAPSANAASFLRLGAWFERHNQFLDAALAYHRGLERDVHNEELARSLARTRSLLGDADPFSDLDEIRYSQSLNAKAQPGEATGLPPRAK